MPELTETAPAAWPSYSDLAQIVRMSVSGFGRYVRSWRDRVDVREIGREKRVPPDAAVALLVGRGLPGRAAEREVARVVESRSSGMPVLTTQPGDPSSTPSDEQLLQELRQQYDAMVLRMRTPGFDRRMRKI